jgi:hypothetical protein
MRVLIHISANRVGKVYMSMSFGDFFTTTMFKAKYMPEIFFPRGSGLAADSVSVPFRIPLPLTISSQKNKTLISILVYFDPGVWVRGHPLLSVFLDCCGKTRMRLMEKMRAHESLRRMGREPRVENPRVRFRITPQGNNREKVF